MTFRLARAWIGWCALLGLVASCSSSGGGDGTGGSSATGGGAGSPAAGGKTGSGGGSAGSGGASGSGGGSAGSGGPGGPGGASASGGSGGGQSVGTSGGTVAQAGVTLSIPANALAASTIITVSTTAAPSGYTLASQAYQFGPSGTTFAQPVAVTIPLTSATTAGVHLFWSNASGGFDDVGGTVTGSNLTANVSHFSIGFCAVPSGNSGSGGASAIGGASGSKGTGGAAGASGVGGQAGAAATGGNSGTGTGGSGTGAGGTGTGAGGMSGATDAGLSGDAAASLCKSAGALNLPSATITNTDAAAPPGGSTYTGGTIPSVKYYLKSVTHYGSAPYMGTRQAQYTIDATAKTIVIDESLGNVSQYTAMTFVYFDAIGTMQATVVCNTGTTPTGTIQIYYTVNGAQLTMSVAGSNDVSVYGEIGGG